MHYGLIMDKLKTNSESWGRGLTGSAAGLCDQLLNHWPEVKIFTFIYLTSLWEGRERSAAQHWISRTFDPVQCPVKGRYGLQQDPRSILSSLSPLTPIYPSEGRLSGPKQMPSANHNKPFNWNWIWYSAWTFCSFMVLKYIQQYIFIYNIIDI